MTASHFNIRHRFDVLLFENTFSTHRHIGKEGTNFSMQDPVYYIFYTEKASTDHPNEALWLLEDGPAFMEEDIVLCRVAMQDQYIHLWQGDKERAINVVIEYVHFVWHCFSH